MEGREGEGGESGGKREREREGGGEKSQEIVTCMVEQ